VRALVFALALVLPSPAVAQVGALDVVYCRLWPSKCAQPPVPIPEPAPAIIRPPPERPVVTQRAPPSAVKAKPVRKVQKWKPAPAAKRRAAADNSGPDLPWPCWMVRMRAGGKTNAELAAEGKSRGIKLSRKQERQALACLGR
jgi:hypothetical protein